MAEVTEDDAENLPLSLAAAKPDGAGLCLASSGRYTSNASMLFRFAVRARLIDRNPFDGVRRGSMATEHKAYVDRETSAAVIEALPSTQWKLLFALARYAGLRTPSEPSSLRWGDIGWEHGRFIVTSPKTAHHRGHESRVVPIFPELLPLLEARFDEAEEGDELVLPMMQGKVAAAFRQRVWRTLDRLGVPRWKRVFHNLRSSCQTDLQEKFPAHVVCDWLGHSEAIARLHHLQVLESHFEQAAQNPAQSVSAEPRTGAQTDSTQSSESLECRS